VEVPANNDTSYLNARLTFGSYILGGLHLYLYQFNRMKDNDISTNPILRK